MNGNDLTSMSRTSSPGAGYDVEIRVGITERHVALERRRHTFAWLSLVPTGRVFVAESQATERREAAAAGRCVDV